MARKTDVTLSVDNDVWLEFKNRAIGKSARASEAIEGLMQLANTDSQLLEDAIDRR